MKPSKKFLTHSLFAVYKELLLEKSDVQLEKELFELAEDSAVYSEKEIFDNKKRMEEMRKILPYKELHCEIDGSVLTWYDDPEEKTGKNLIGSAGFIVRAEEEVLMKQSFSIPKKYAGQDTTSHIAEYQALISCLRVLYIYHTKPEHLSLTIYSDSEVTVKQINMAVTTRKDYQRELRDEALYYMRQFKDVKLVYIPREQNKDADKLAKSNTIKERETLY